MTESEMWVMNMEWFSVYQEELEQVFAEAERRTAAFPEPLNELGLAYLNRFNPLQKDSTRNYICYLLPFWLQDQTRLPVESNRQLSLGNVFVMAYFLIQDDLMDTAVEDWKMDLALGNLFYTECLDVYRNLLPGTSPFWRYFQTYIHEWAGSVTNEGKQDFFQGERLQVSLKASPLKMASTGALLLAGDEESVQPVTTMIDTALLVLQMADDWADWEEDIQENSYNCLLSHISATQHIPYMQGLQAEHIRAAIYSGGLFTQYAQIATSVADNMQASSPTIPYLLQFAQSIALGLQEDAAQINAERIVLRHGGLDYWLSKNMK